VRVVLIVSVTLTLAALQGGSEMYMARRLECRSTTLCSGPSSRTCSWREKFKYFRRMPVRFDRMLVENTSRIGLRVTGVVSPPSRAVVMVGSATSKASVSRWTCFAPRLYVQTYLQYSCGVSESLRKIFLWMDGDFTMVAWKCLETRWWTKRSRIGRRTRVFSRTSGISSAW